MTCFTTGHFSPRNRPDLRTWVAALTEAEAALVQCSTNEQHYYLGSERTCTWCERTRRLNGADPFPARQKPSVEIEFSDNPDLGSSRISMSKEKMFMIARRYDDVFKQAKRTRELSPNSYVTALHVLETYQLLGRYTEAIDEFETHPEPGSMSQEETTAFATTLRSALHSQGPQGYWSVLLQDRLDTDADDHCLLAYAYFRTGDHENGYPQLELAIKGRDRNLRQMKTNPMWDFVRDDPRFQDVLRRVGY